MKTVLPTLCATATVVAASAVGLSFGREAPVAQSHPQKKKATPARDQRDQQQSATASSMPAVVQSAAPAPSPVHAFGAPISAAPASRSTRSSQDGRPSRWPVRRTASSDAALQRPPNGSVAQGQPAASPDTAAGDPDSIQASSRRASWMKRLSTMSTSQASSRNPSPSPAPLSPSVSCSNGSMAFSHDGSTAPMIGRRPPSPLPPNKLVKRSLSVRSPRDPALYVSGSLRPSFRRPATSHQRSAQYQNALLETAVEVHSVDDLLPSPNTDSEVEYARYFTAKVTRERTLSKRRRSSANVHSFRRVFPDGKHRPTLVLAGAVSAGADAPDEASSDGESDFFVSRPNTPLSITAVITTNVEASHPADHTHARPTAAPSDNVSRPRRSFSITDLFSSAPTRKSRSVAAKLTRRASQRVQSAPVMTTLSRRRHSSSSTDQEQQCDMHRLHTAGAAACSHVATTDGVFSAQSAEKLDSDCVRHQGLTQISSPDPLPVFGDSLASRPPLEVIASAALATNQTPSSPTLAQSGVRNSTAPSEQASTLVGSSDNEVRFVSSGDEDDVDLHSDTVFDSLRTGATRSTSGGARGPRIETIFDESPPSKTHKVTALRDLLPTGLFGEHALHAAPGHQSIAEEEESISTPVRTVRPERSLQDSPSFSRTLGAPLFPNLIPSSPPSMPKPLSLGTLEWDADAGGDDDSSRWSFDEQHEDPWVDLPPASHVATPVPLRHQSSRLSAVGSSSKPATPQHLASEHGDRDARSSIFDWSEQQLADRSSGNRTPPRPRTVHGKKDAERRGSRSVGRRATSGLHARSQSVPVVPDASGKRSTVVTNKFGTWGVGSKGVTEDWNDDFDFSELQEEPIAEGSDSALRTDSVSAMVVPKSIQEQQNNVLANIGLLREWGLLIEELKEHKARAMTLEIIKGSHADIWEEVDAMIELADQEADHEGVSRLSPPSSPGFDEAAFEDAPSHSPVPSRANRTSDQPGEDAGRHLVLQLPLRRKSILPPNLGIFGAQPPPAANRPAVDTSTLASTSHPNIITRPRKDSEAKARSVIEALQKRRSIHDPTTNTPPTPSSRKVPFDTATLRRIVPYVNTLTRKVKDVIRDAEGLYSSPDSTSGQQEPALSRMFQQDADLAAQTKLMTVM